MIKEGDIVLFKFPQTDLEQGKLRPAVLIKKIPNGFDDWLVCMVSTQLFQKVEVVEIIVSEKDLGFTQTGLKKDSLIRTTRIAVVEASIFAGKLGSLPDLIFTTIKQSFASWIIE
jgi:mRNA interferase MazF